MLTYLQRLRIATKLWLLIAVFTAVGVADNLSEMALISKQLHAEKETQLKHLVETAHTVLQSYHRAAKDGRLPEDLARRLAADAVRQLHYGSLEYFWIHDLGQPVPTMVMHPTVPSLDGKSLVDPRFSRATAMRSGAEGPYQKLAGTNLFVAMNQAIAATGEGFVRYDWPKPIAAGGVTEQQYPKLSYVKKFDAWGWVIGSGIYIDDLDAEYWRDVKVRLVKAALWVLLLGLLVWLITRTVVRPLQAFQGAIDDLRANPDSAPKIPAEQPGELGHLSLSFIGLMEDLRRSRNELTSSIDKLRQAARAFSHLKEGIFISDAEGRIVSANPAMTRLTGHEAEALIGQTLTLLHAEAHEPAFYDKMWEQLRHNGQWSGTVQIKTKDTSVRSQWLAIVALRNQTGELQWVFGVYSTPDGTTPQGA